MRKAIVLFAVLFCTLTATAQQKTDVTIGNGYITREVREIEDFTKLNVNGPFEVRLISGKAGSLIIEAEKNLTDLITTEVQGQVLTIAPQKGKLFKSSKGNKIIVKVPVANINEIVFNGSGSITGKETITNDIKVSLNGSGNIALDIAAKKVEAIVTGTGNIMLNGKADTFECKIAGSGGIRAQELQSSTVMATVNGSGNADVFSNKEIMGRITGSGNIGYAGSPVQKDLKTTGTGQFRVY